MNLMMLMWFGCCQDLFMRIYEVIRAYEDKETRVFFIVGDVVEVLDSKQKNGMWLVRKQSEREQVSLRHKLSTQNI